ncbi:MAG: choice-of-anchor D domain-containing protein [Acetobacteraceae bacterium]
MADVITVINIIPNLQSGETNGDSEANLAVNPANVLEMVATAFTPSPNLGSGKSPVFFSNDGGLTWALKDLINATPVRDQTMRFATTSGELYGGVLWGTGSNIANINFDILRTNDFTSFPTMTVLKQRKNDDQPFIEAETVPSGADAGKDRIYVGSNDHAPSAVPATIDLSLDAGAPTPIATSTLVIEQRTVARDGFPTRPAIHPDGVVYAIYYALVSPNCDVVIVRDDNWGSGGSPFLALIDSDGKQGIRIAQNVGNPFGGSSIGQQRLGSDLAIAVDLRNSATVYVSWADFQSGTQTLFVARSTDSGAHWSAPLRSITNATNPALAIDAGGRLGFLYQQVTGNPNSQNWQTTLEFTRDDFATITTYILANTPAATPAFGGNPYLGDYLSMMAVGRSFFGIFTANNTPDKANFPNDVAYQRNANFATKTLLANNNTTPVAVSIDPFVFKVVPGVGRVVTAIADAGNFGRACVGSFVDEELTIDNGGNGELSISNITSSSPDFLVPSVVSYPILLGVGDAIEIPIRFAPTTPGGKSGVITIFSNDPAGPHKVAVSGVAATPRLSLAIANKGNFGKVCIGRFADEALVLNNSGHCPLTVRSITSSSAEFLVPEVISFPLLIGPGDSLDLPIRFAPVGFGAKTATITVVADDPASPHSINVSGQAPSGKLAVSGSLCFGGVKACCRSERTLQICNVGECPLHVTSVKFKRKNPHWKLINSPFPASLVPGSCLGVVIRYKATEKCPIACELVIESDDPTTPVKTLDVMAYTVWDECCCKCGCDECHGKGCERCRCKGVCEGAADDCCADEDED